MFKKKSKLYFTITLFLLMSFKAFAMPDMISSFSKVSFIDAQSKNVKLSDYENKILLVFFGYTHCPDICPTTLIDITKSLRELGDDAEKVQPIFISVDYKRDSPERLSKYMEFFDERIIALTSSHANLKTISKDFRTTFELIDPSTSNYLVEHSSNLYIIDQNFQVKRIIANGLPSSEITQTVKTLLN